MRMSVPEYTLLIRVLEFVQMVSDGGTPFALATWFWTDEYKPENSVMNVMPSEWSELRARAYMRLLNRYGLINGCHCGCRGDYELTEKGNELLEALVTCDYKTANCPKICAHSVPHLPLYDIHFPGNGDFCSKFNSPCGFRPDEPMCRCVS